MRAGQNSTSGGSSDSAANDWQAKPAGPAWSAVVITVTPVQKCPSTCRNRAGSGSWATGVRPAETVMRPGPSSCAPTG